MTRKQSYIAVRSCNVWSNRLIEIQVARKGTLSKNSRFMFTAERKEFDQADSQGGRLLVKDNRRDCSRSIANISNKTFSRLSGYGGEMSGKNVS